MALPLHGNWASLLMYANCRVWDWMDGGVARLHHGVAHTLSPLLVLAPWPWLWPVSPPFGFLLDVHQKACCLSNQLSDPCYHRWIEMEQLGQSEENGLCAHDFSQEKCPFAGAESPTRAENVREPTQACADQTCILWISCQISWTSSSPPQQTGAAPNKLQMSEQVGTDHRDAHVPEVHPRGRTCGCLRRS